MKKIIAMVLILVLLSPLTPAFAVQTDQPEGDTSQIYRAYLKQWRNDIEACESQLTGQASWNQGSVWFQDLTKDGIPEMILCRPTEGQNISLDHSFKIKIQIFTVMNGSLQLMAEKDNIIISAALGNDYMMFTLKDSADLLLVHSYAGYGNEDAQYTESYIRISSQDNESLQSIHVLDAKTFTDGNTGEESTDYFEDGKRVSKDRYTETETALLSQADRCLFCNGRDNWSSDWSAPRHRAYELKTGSLSLSDALEQLSHQTAETLPSESVGQGSTTPSSLSENALALLNAIGGRDYWFASGGGGWGDRMTLHKDGTFTGCYSYTNMGDEDPELGTLVTESYCNYSGRILEITPITENSYHCRISVTPDQTPGQVSRSQDDHTVKRVSVDLGGMAKTDSLTLYTPGQLLKDTPEDFQHWNFFTGSTSDKLENIGFYNPNIQSGAAFFASSSQVSIPIWEEPILIEAYNTSATLSGSSFEGNPEDFDWNLAKLCAILSKAAEDGPEAADDILKCMDVDASNSKSLEHDEHLGCMTAAKKMMVDGKPTTVLFIVARGSISKLEFLGDRVTWPEQFTTRGPWAEYNIYGLPWMFSGFLRGKTMELLQELGPEVYEHPIKVVITGHSLGGAAANLMAASFILDKDLERIASRENVYAYTFGAIDSLGKGKTYDLPVRWAFENIHNVFNICDTYGPNGQHVVTASGNSGIGKFGHMDLFEIDKKAPILQPDNHLIETYIEALNRKLVVHNMACNQVPKAMTELQKVDVENVKKCEFLDWIISCPVDVDVLRGDQVLGGVKNEEVFILEQPSSIRIWADKGRKHLLIPADCRLRIQAYDTGTMTVDMQSYDAMGNPTAAATYSSIPLEPGQEWIGSAEDMKLPVLKTVQDQKILTPDGMSETENTDGQKHSIFFILGFSSLVLICLLVFFILKTKKKKSNKGKCSR